MSVHRRISGVFQMVYVSAAFWLYPLPKLLRHLLTGDERHWEDAMGTIDDLLRAWHEGLIWTLTGRRIPEE